jgi:hypothetical protein
MRPQPEVEPPLRRGTRVVRALAWLLMVCSILVTVRLLVFSSQGRYGQITADTLLWQMIGVLFLLALGVVAVITRRRLQRVWRWVAAVLAVLLVVGVVLVQYAGGPLPMSYKVAMPPDTASPAEVVATLVTALNAHDAATVNALYAPSHMGGNWTNALHSIRLVKVRKATRLTAADGSPYWKAGGVSVDVVINPKWRVLDGSGDGADGPQPYTYILTKSGPHGAWRVVDEGTG